MVRFDHDQSLLEVSFTGGSTSADAKKFFATVNEILDSKRDFVCLIETDGESPFPEDEKKELARWYKERKADLKAHCVALARLCPQKGILSKLSTKAMQLAMPCPYMATGSRDEALAWLKSKA